MAIDIGDTTFRLEAYDAVMSRLVSVIVSRKSCKMRRAQTSYDCDNAFQICESPYARSHTFDSARTRCERSHPPGWLERSHAFSCVLLERRARKKVVHTICIYVCLCLLSASPSPDQISQLTRQFQARGLSMYRFFQPFGDNSGIHMSDR